MALLKSSMHIWRNMAATKRYYNNTLARKTLVALRKLLWVRSAAGRVLMRSRGLSLLLATRIYRAGRSALLQSFKIWAAGVGMISLEIEGEEEKGEGRDAWYEEKRDNEEGRSPMFTNRILSTRSSQQLNSLTASIVKVFID